MSKPQPALPWRRAGAELIFLIGVGVIMAFIGPYGTGRMSIGPSLIYWIGSIVGGGVIGITIDETLGRRLAPLWRRVAATSLLMTPLVALLVIAIGRIVTNGHDRQGLSAVFLVQVFVISALVMTLRALTWRPARTVVQTRTVVAAPLPEAEAAFRMNLSARRRSARLIAIEAEDHYLRVHTDAGEELLTMRFADALAMLSAAHGFQTHRSWWIAADAVEQVRWSKGLGQASLAGGLVAPVSRRHATTLKEAGWF